MKKNKLYIFIALLIPVILFTSANICLREMGIGTDVPESQEDRDLEQFRREIEVEQGFEQQEMEIAYMESLEKKWKEQQEKSINDIKKGSEQPEDVQDLNNEKDEYNIITLKGKASSEIEAPITITIDQETNIVEGKVTLKWWEETRTSGEGGEEHHSHEYKCEVYLRDATIWGTVDERGVIKASVTGFTSCSYGYDPNSNVGYDQAGSFCSEQFNNKPENFTLTGNYDDNLKTAYGEILPHGWNWGAD